ncbi:hypothetical protein [Nordella sp. HKS 07]|uniref:hypothetical protein n=1 Tax=Nordella sp. HKS 07 TaxID=2712222 RepID=UPI001FEDB2E9|nr:hypothetical protein [Nordella sp. HKS 07]
MKKPSTPFLGSRFSASPKATQAALFGAPHGTPYKGIDNRPYEKAPDALRKALKADAAFLDSWDFDFGGPLLGKKDNIVSRISAICRLSRNRARRTAS